MIPRRRLGKFRKLTTTPVKVSSIYNRSSKAGTIASYIFGKRMYHYISPMFDRIQQHRGSHCIIYYQRNFVLLSHFGNRLYIQHIQLRITQCLYKNSTGVFFHRLVKIGYLLRIYKGCGNPKAWQGYIEQVISTSIEAVGRYDMIPRTQERKESCRKCSRS